MKNVELTLSSININDALNKLTNPENKESVLFQRLEDRFSSLDKKSTEKCCERLNNCFTKNFGEQWIDFMAALEAKVPKSEIV